MSEPIYALSIKQPWATLVVHGLKRIEIRRWKTKFRGPVLIHAAKQFAPQPQAWVKLPDELKTFAELQGGIIGAVDMVGCREYRSVEAFRDDVDWHLNEPSWFLPPVMYGFEFAQPRLLPFRPLPGWVRFFRVEEAAR
jgi:hypothetical protein